MTTIQRLNQLLKTGQKCLEMDLAELEAEEQQRMKQLLRWLLSELQREFQRLHAEYYQQHWLSRRSLSLGKQSVLATIAGLKQRLESLCCEISQLQCQMP